MNIVVGRTSAGLNTASVSLCLRPRACMKVRTRGKDTLIGDAEPFSFPGMSTLWEWCGYVRVGVWSNVLRGLCASKTLIPQRLRYISVITSS